MSEPSYFGSREFVEDMKRAGEQRARAASTFYIATCPECNPRLSHTFADAQVRDKWAAEHSEKTGHPVLIADGSRP